MNGYPRQPTQWAMTNCPDNTFWETIDSFQVTRKLYGDTNQKAECILNTFNNREVSTGVSLTGGKGSGKALLAKRISMLAAGQGVPTIVVNEPWCGDQFNQFLQIIEQRVVVLFDEFEKVHHDCEKQEQIMLTLLDGVYPSKKLFILTCNNKWRLDSYEIDQVVFTTVWIMPVWMINLFVNIVRTTCKTSNTFPRFAPLQGFCIV
jgi:ATPase family associated with various cellular activities (AAA)